MTLTLVGKLLRDIRVPLLVTVLLLSAFELFWVKVTQRIVTQLTPFFTALAGAQKLQRGVLEQQLFQGPGRVFQTLIGGSDIDFGRAMDSLTIGYLHPVLQTLICIWAVGRAAGALAGELDRGTMELLLAQPVPRGRVVLAHLVVDALVIPLLCLSLWSGTLLGTWLIGPFEVNMEPIRLLNLQFTVDPITLRVDPWAFGVGLWNVGALMFAISGYTMFLSSRGRYRLWSLGQAVLVTLVQFVINVLGQLWDGVAWLRPFTVFYYYQPQRIVLHREWAVDPGLVWNGGTPLVSLNVIAVLLTVGAVGYGLAYLTFTRRDLPAPL
jgi:ABC-2 type transport system permease protein